MCRAMFICLYGRGDVFTWAEACPAALGIVVLTEEEWMQDEERHEGRQGVFFRGDK